MSDECWNTSGYMVKIYHSNMVSLPCTITNRRTHRLQSLGSGHSFAVYYFRSDLHKHFSSLLPSPFSRFVSLVYVTPIVPKPLLLTRNTNQPDRQVAPWHSMESVNLVEDNDTTLILLVCSFWLNFLNIFWGQLCYYIFRNALNHRLLFCHLYSAGSQGFATLFVH